MDERGQGSQESIGGESAQPRRVPLSTGLARRLWFGAGMTCVGLGIAGVILPVMPGVVFFIMAAACFARSSPEFERRLVTHPQLGPHIVAWRERRAISRKGKWSAILAILFGAAFSAFTLPLPYALITPLVAVVLVPWIWTRPDG